MLDAGDGVKNQLEALADDVEGDGNRADASRNSCVAAMRRVASDMEEQITSLNNLKEHLEQVLEELEKQTARENGDQEVEEDAYGYATLLATAELSNYPLYVEAFLNPDQYTDQLLKGALDSILSSLADADPVPVEKLPSEIKDILSYITNFPGTWLRSFQC